MQWFRVDLKTFLGLDMPNQCCHAVKKLMFGRFLVGFLAKNPNLNDPYIYTVVLLYYMIMLITSKNRVTKLCFKSYSSLFIAMHACQNICQPLMPTLKVWSTDVSATDTEYKTDEIYIYSEIGFEPMPILQATIMCNL